MKKFFENLRIKIRTWNPNWFVNPFFSPSVTAFEAGKIVMNGFFGIKGRFPMSQNEKELEEFLSRLNVDEFEFKKAYLNEFPQPLQFTPPLLIVAGDYNQCRILANINRIPRKHWRNVERLDDLCGRTTGSIVFWGNWYNLPRYQEIRDYADILIARGRLDLFEADNQDFLHEHQRSES